jgi:hypothetical protein
MSLQLQTFKGFTPTMFASFAAKTEKDTSTKIIGNSGTVVHGSFTFTYNFNPTTETLEIQCLKKPLFIPASTIINGIAEEVAELITSTINTPPIPSTETSVEKPIS